MLLLLPRQVQAFLAICVDVPGAQLGRLETTLSLPILDQSQLLRRTS